MGRGFGLWLGPLTALIPLFYPHTPPNNTDTRTHACTASISTIMAEPPIFGDIARGDLEAVNSHVLADAGVLKE